MQDTITTTSTTIARAISAYERRNPVAYVEDVTGFRTAADIEAAIFAAAIVDRVAGYRTDAIARIVYYGVREGKALSDAIHSVLWDVMKCETIAAVDNQHRAILARRGISRIISGVEWSMTISTPTGEPRLLRVVSPEWDTAPASIVASVIAWRDPLMTGIIWKKDTPRAERVTAHMVRHGAGWYRTARVTGIAHVSTASVETDLERDVWSMSQTSEYGTHTSAVYMPR